MDVRRFINQLRMDRAERRESLYASDKVYKLLDLFDVAREGGGRSAVNCPKCFAPMLKLDGVPDGYVCIEMHKNEIHENVNSGETDG